VRNVIWGVPNETGVSSSSLSTLTFGPLLRSKKEGNQ